MKDLIDQWLGEAFTPKDESNLEKALREASAIIDAPAGEHSHYSWRYREGIRGADRRHAKRH
ncbi:TPA: hypothetical protein HA242_03550 [Candidatus Woesearchaeota archaeon]|nr:hypothetical protein [Candidatus Woesearchaeota archaeon]HIG93484.1 hypothetical protein [Candidatus Woesearchaeota archaeon]HIH12770.1 hypothetical protein [Candidatus Woesearchaeota archaeon]